MQSVQRAGRTKTVALATFVPRLEAPVAAPAPREVWLVVDGSGSMGGEPERQARDAAHFFIKDLPSGAGGWLLGWDGMGWDGMGWDGMGWDGMGWDGMGWDGLGWAGLGWAGLAWPGLAWPGLAWPGLAWPGLAWPGLLAQGC